jgi:hypothetical protein
LKAVVTAYNLSIGVERVWLKGKKRVQMGSAFFNVYKRKTNYDDKFSWIDN